MIDETREFLRDNFDNAVLEDGDLVVYTNFADLRCIPENAMVFLNAEQRNILQNCREFSFFNTAIERVHENSFLISDVGLILDFRFDTSELSELPDGVFDNFTSLTTLSVSNNRFVTLNNNLLGSIKPNLVVLFVNGNEDLEEFPEAFRSAINVEEINFIGSNNIFTASSLAFQQINSSTSFPNLITNGVKIDIYSPVAANGISILANELNLPENVILLE